MSVFKYIQKLPRAGGGFRYVYTSPVRGLRAATSRPVATFFSPGTRFRAEGVGRAHALTAASARRLTRLLRRAFVRV